MIQVAVCWKGWKKEVEKNIDHDFKNSLTAKVREEKYQYMEKNVRPRVFYELGDTEACLVVNKNSPISMEKWKTQENKRHCQKSQRV